MIHSWDAYLKFHFPLRRVQDIARGLKVIVVAACAATALSGCVYHYCGPAYPNSTDPFCKIHFPAPMM